MGEYAHFYVSYTAHTIPVGSNEKLTWKCANFAKAASYGTNEATPRTHTWYDIRTLSHEEQWFGISLG